MRRRPVRRALVPVAPSRGCAARSRTAVRRLTRPCLPRSSRLRSYNDLQSTFFQNATAAVSRRDAMYSFLALASTGSLLLWGAKGAKDAKLPITIGPQQKPALGPRDRL